MINFDTAAVNARLFAANTAAALLPLEAIDTGNPIPHFPQTIAELHALNGILPSLPANGHKRTNLSSGARANAILAALGATLPPGTDLRTKREAILRKWIH